jgi:hypothetical protein
MLSDYIVGFCNGVIWFYLYYDEAVFLVQASCFILFHILCRVYFAVKCMILVEICKLLMKYLWSNALNALV